MDFNGFSEYDFETFKIDGLENRMEAIQTRIQPKFQVVGSELTDYLSAQLNQEMHLHIARHARRTVNPPDDTWLGVSDNKRGYKKHPHFQIGLWDDHLFIWLALIYELDFKEDIAKAFINNFDKLKALPNHYAVSLDHMKNKSSTIAELDIKDLERFRDVKKAEFLVGQHLLPNDERLKDPKLFIETVKKTINHLIPFYQIAIGCRHNNR